MDNPNLPIRKLHTDGISLSLHLYIIETFWENFIIKDCNDVPFNWIPMDGLHGNLLEFTFPYCAGAQLQSIYLFNSSLWVDNYPDVDNFYKKLQADPSYYETMKKHDHLLGLALLATVWGIRLLLKQHWMHLLVPLILAETELLRFWFPLGWDLF